MTLPREETEMIRRKRTREELPISQHLEVLMFEDDVNIDRLSDSHVRTEILIALLSTPALKALTTSFCDLLTDNVLREVLAQHRFRNLEHLQWECCDALTERGVNLLLSDDNALTHLCVVRCKSLTEHVIEMWREKVMQEEWDLTDKGA